MPRTQASNNTAMDHRKEITVSISHLSDIKTRRNVEIHVLAVNDDLVCYGPDVANSAWEAEICPAEKVKQDVKCPIVSALGAYVRLIGSPNVSAAARVTIELLDKNGAVAVLQQTPEDDERSFTAGPTTPETLSYGCQLIHLNELFASPERYRDNNCVVVRFTINFRVVAGGDLPDSPVHQLRLLGKVYTLKPPSDLTLVSSDGKRFPVHREFLATCSAEWAKWLEGQSANGTVQMPTVDASTLRRLLEDCYSCPQQSIPPQEALRYLVAAKQFRVDNRYERALSEIDEKVPVAEVFDILKVATEHSLDRPKQRALEALLKRVPLLTIETAIPVMEYAVEHQLEVLVIAAKKVLEKLAVSVDTAATALKIAARFAIPLLTSKALTVIDCDMGGFAAAGGFSDLPSELTIVIENHAKNERARKKQKT